MVESPEQKTEALVEIEVVGVTLRGVLAIPEHPKGIVLFAHGSGSSRVSPRNTFVARVLQDGGCATLLIDLLEEREAADRSKVFDIDLLADRLHGITGWLGDDPKTQAFRIGYFGASTGAAAALQAAARSPGIVGAVVSRGGRPDLAEAYLKKVTAPTLLIVGGDDRPVLTLNEHALRLLPCPKELRIILGATHLFEEPGTLKQVADLARDWFVRFLPASA